MLRDQIAEFAQQRGALGGRAPGPGGERRFRGRHGGIDVGYAAPCDLRESLLSGRIDGLEIVRTGGRQPVD